MRKPGKPDYRVPGAHQPIVLSHGHARALKACIADEITCRAELLGLIPPQQFGARPGRNTTDSIHMMVDSIKEAWRKGEVASVLYMDIKGTFPSVDLQMLYHELLSLGIPSDIVEWLKRRYADRTTQMVFDDFVSEPMKVLGGEDQGDPAAGIGYILYAAGVLGTFKRDEKEEGFGFMDDIAVMKTGKSVEETHSRLAEIMTREQGVMEWVKTHNCTFGIDKFKLVEFTRRREPMKGGTQTVLNMTEVNG